MFHCHHRTTCLVVPFFVIEVNMSSGALSSLVKELQASCAAAIKKHSEAQAAAAKEAAAQRAQLHQSQNVSKIWSVIANHVESKADEIRALVANNPCQPSVLLPSPLGDVQAQLDDEAKQLLQERCHKECGFHLSFVGDDSISLAWLV